jgi:hypothetical protein
VNKKKQNTLLIWAVPVSLPQAQSDKIFAPPFKKRLLSLLGDGENLLVWCLDRRIAVAEKKLAAVLFLPSTGSRPTMMPSIITSTAAAGLGKGNTAP